jgi:hypothetical protein
MVYSHSEEDYVEHVKWIGQHNLEDGIYSQPQKYVFDNITYWYKGLNRSTNCISMDQNMINTVSNCQGEKKNKNRSLDNLFEVHQFLRIFNYD